MSNLQIDPNKRFKGPRPLSVLITQILMVISFVPLALGVGVVLIRTLIDHPSDILSVRGVTFLSLSFGLTIVFPFYGFRGLTHGTRYGYWMGLMFLLLGSVASIYKLASELYVFSLSGSHQYKFLSKEMILFGVGMRAGMVGLVLGLLLRFGFGKKERTFFLNS